MISASSMTQSVSETMEAIVFSCPCSHALQFKCLFFLKSVHYRSVHRMNVPNCAGHFKCEEALSEQKEVFSGFLFLFCCFFRKHLKQLAETQPYKCAVLWGGSQRPCNVIEYPKALCCQRFRGAGG